jgi:hypothetical protein
VANSCAKASERVFNATTRVDVNAASPQLRYREVTLSCPTGLVVQNTSQYLQHVCTTTSGETVVGAYVTFAVAPACAGGTSTLGIKKYDTDGSTTTTIVTAADILAGYTAFIPVEQTLAASVSLTAGQSIVVTVATSNNVVGTADKGATVTLLLAPVEDSVISD